MNETGKTERIKECNKNESNDTSLRKNLIEKKLYENTDMFKKHLEYKIMKLQLEMKNEFTKEISKLN